MNYNLILEVLSLSILQSVLMIDNVIFISVLTEELKPTNRIKARLIGLFASLVLNTALILSAGFIIEYSHFELINVANKVKLDLHHSLMLFGGLFLIWKTAKEIRHKHELNGTDKPNKVVSLTSTIITMIGVDLVFSIDSTLTAIGMSDSRQIQVASTLVAILFMFVFFNLINKVTSKYPSLKTLALCFLFLIGFNLLLEGLGKELEKGYTYFAMLFALFAEFIDIWLFSKTSKK